MIFGERHNDYSGQGSPIIINDFINHVEKELVAYSGFPENKKSPLNRLYYRINYSGLLHELEEYNNSTSLVAPKFFLHYPIIIRKIDSSNKGGIDLIFESELKDLDNLSIQADFNLGGLSFYVQFTRGFNYEGFTDLNIARKYLENFLSDIS